MLWKLFSFFVIQLAIVAIKVAGLHGMSKQVVFDVLACLPTAQATASRH